MIPFIYSNHFWQLITPPALLLTTQMNRQAEDYERRRIMQQGFVQAHQSDQTKGHSGKQNQESRLYN